MIDGRKLTSILLGEARLFADHMKFDDATNLKLEEKFARLVASSPLPESEQIAVAIEEVFWASLLTEEGRPCRPRLLYSPRQECMRPAVHRLAKPIRLNRDALRKLAPAQGPLGYLAWDCASGDAEITGIQGREGGDPCDLIISAPKNGALEIDWSCARLLTFQAGRLDRLSMAALPGVHEALDIVRRLTGNFEPVFLNRTIQAIAAAGHGGAIWILREGCALDGVHLGYPLQRDERPLPQRHDVRFKWLASVGYLAMTDGAVLVDSRVKVLGFGAFIDVPDRPRMVTVHSYEGDAKQLESTKLGGGRHRSAVEFCVRFAPAAAIVVSEDGRISAMWAAAGAAPHFAPFSTLGLLTDTIL